MKIKKIQLLESQEDAFFLDGIKEFYDVIQADKFLEVDRKIVPNRRLKSFLVRLLIHIPLLHQLKFNLWDNRKISFTAMISGDFSVLLPYVIFSKQNFVYMHDVWPRFQSWIFPLLDLFSVKYVFFSSKQVWMDHLKKYPNSSCKSIWLPEGIDATQYVFKPFDQKQIDVLEFGRRYEDYHLLIRDELALHAKQHIYRLPDTGLLFQQKTDLIKALAQTKIVICVPSAITHPERAEYISSMTLRYLQAMASKCLIVGITPFDMGELFDYNAIVEIDMQNAAQQLLAILENYESYIPLIEKNYLAVYKNHQWLNRWQVVKEKIEEVS
ncbi:MAG: hypothetical protein EOO42_01630 [Flavobacteriales bacterium]|nr:MAG: hypothetical protein EOO42_01630 [Flavobacteriales bacterium]